MDQRLQQPQMSEAFRTDYRMTVEAFHAFLADRPDWEKWELIDGEAIVQASPKLRHQQIVGNTLFEIERARRETAAKWIVIGGIGTRVLDDAYNELIPDVVIMPAGGDDLSNWTLDVLVAFEVLSPGSVRRDMVRKRAVYQRMQALTHYMVVAQDRREVTVFARDAGFEPRKLTDDDVLEIPQLGIVLPLAEIYRDIRLD